MDSRKSTMSLAETLHSLLGLKAHLTSSWVNSVCDIIKALPTDKKSRDFGTKDDSSGAISKIKEELAALNAHVNQLNVKRRQILNDFLELKGNIRVFCRIRPITVGENFGGLRFVVPLDANYVLLKLDGGKSKGYSFDRVFHPASSQDDVFSEVEPVIKSVLDGYNACIFAYGQTGTGKTFTMEGSPEAPGVVPRALEALVKQAVDSNHAFLISFSMLEIYQGNIRDLLAPKPTKATDPMPPCLSIQTDPKGGIEINNLLAFEVNDFNQALTLYRLGCRFRSTASTDLNTTSSRSHCMIRMAITCFDAPERRRETNKIWLVDLGGSERVLKTKAWGKRLDEGKAINLSLSALGDVINALQRKKHHIPYRNSKLTQLLKDSLGDDSKTLMLVHVSPKEEDLCETLCSLNFATRVKSTHLGFEDTIEVKQQKEVVMSSLQQKLKQIEDEQLHVRTDIKILNKELQNLTGLNSHSEDLQEAYHLSSEGLLTMSRDREITAAPSSKLPGFMRPTICSRRRAGTSYHMSEGKDSVLRRRRSLSDTESVTLPVKDHSEKTSESIISRSSCLAGLNLKSSIHNATEASQVTAETCGKIIDLREQERARKTLLNQKGAASCAQKISNSKVKVIKYTKFAKVDNWLHLQKIESITNGYTHRMKQFLAIPNPDKTQKHNGRGKAERFCDENIYNYDFRIQKVVSHNKNNLNTSGEVGRPAMESVTDRPLTMLKDLFDEDSRSFAISTSNTTEGKTGIHTQETAGSILIKDNECPIFHPPDGCLSSVDNNEANASSMMEAVEGKAQCFDSFLLINSKFHKYSLDMGGNINYTKRDSHTSTSTSELEPGCQQAIPEWHMEAIARRDFDVSIQFGR